MKKWPGEDNYSNEGSEVLQKLSADGTEKLEYEAEDRRQS